MVTFAIELAVVLIMTASVAFSWVQLISVISEQSINLRGVSKNVIPAKVTRRSWSDRLKQNPVRHRMWARVKFKLVIVTFLVICGMPR